MSEKELLLKRNEMVVFTLRIIISLNRPEDVIEILQSAIGPICVQPGCISCHLYHDLEYPDELTLVQRWKSVEHLEKQVFSDAFTRLLLAMEMSMEPPEVKFETVCSSAGMEFLESLRARKMKRGKNERTSGPYCG
jgi:quinol monooxygenase YgiN